METLTEAVEAIRQISQEGFWKTKPRTVFFQSKPIAYSEDEIASRELSKDEFQLLVDSCSQHEKIGFFIGNGSSGFAPTFSVVYHPNPLLQGWNGDKTTEYLIRFKEGNLPIPLDDFLEILYSEENKEKMVKFGKEMKSYHSYTY